MNLHNEWMANDDNKNTVINIAKERFDIQRYQSAEGADIVIDGLYNERVVVQNHTNPLNDFKDYKKIHFDINTNAVDGSLITFEDNPYLLTSRIIENGAYKSSIMTECMNTLKYQFSDHLLSVPCITQLATRNSLNVNETTQIIENKDYYLILVQYNDETSKIPDGSRFIFQKEAYKMIASSSIIQKGILQIKVESCQISDKDDLDKGIAYNCDIQPSTPSTNTGWTFEIVGNDEIYEGMSETYTAKIWHDGIEDISTSQTVIWELANSSPSIAYLVEGTVVVGRNVTVSAVSGINYITLKATLSVDNSKVQTKVITIKGIF